MRQRNRPKRNCDSPRIKPVMISRSPMRPLFQLILKAEGFGDWKVEEGEAYCWTPIKTIKVPKRAQLQSFLHEVSHAIVQIPEGPWKNHYHGPKWAAAYGRLVNRYMVLKNPTTWGLFLSKEGVTLTTKTPAFILQTITTCRENAAGRPVQTKNIGKYYGGMWFSTYGKLVNRYMTAARLP